MDEKSYFMNYPDKALPIRIENFRWEITESGFQRLARFWQGTTFLCTGWRLYYNDTTGGAVRLEEDGIARNMRPDCLYLLAPGCRFTTSVTNNPHQFYLHFTLSPIGGGSRDKFFELPLKNEWAVWIREALETPDLGFLSCSRLITDALSSLPREVFSTPPMDKRISESLRFMNRNLAKDLSVSLLGEREGLSEGAYSRLFRKETGKSPYAYLIDLRLDQAANLLRTTDKSVEEIADLCGFRERFHFSRAFKRQTNRSPAEFRRL